MTDRESIYIKNKYTKIYFQIIEKAKVSPYIGYTEKHHIIPRSLGGSDDKLNLVKLTARQHYICHLLLTKMVAPNSDAYHKMIKAYMMMAKCNSVGQDRSYKINSRLFESLKIELSKVQSIQQTGENNSQYLTHWIFNPSIKECKKANKSDPIESGWFVGRVMDWDTHYTQRKCVSCNNIGVMSKRSKHCSKECISNTSKSRMKPKIKQPTTINDEIIKRSSIIGDCLIWNKSTTSGRPQFVFEGKNYQVHKYMYEYSNNTIVDSRKYALKQTCNNIRCINPEHMIKVSLSDCFKSNKKPIIYLIGFMIGSPP